MQEIKRRGIRSVVQAALAGLALAGSAAALAATSASAGLSGLAFEVVDLDVADGQQAQLSWLSRCRRQMSRYAQDRRSTTRRWPMGPCSGQRVFRAASPTRGRPTKASLRRWIRRCRRQCQRWCHHLHGQWHGAQQRCNGHHAWVRARQLRAFGAQRAARDLVLTTSIQGPGSAGFLNPPNAALDLPVVFSEATAYAEVLLGSESALSYLTAASYTPNTVEAIFPVDGYVDSDGKEVSLVFRNDGAEEATGTFYLLVQTSALQIASPVPETPSLWLGLAGLALRAARSKVRRA